MTSPTRHDALAVLTRAGIERDDVSATVGLEGDALDALLVSDLLRASGRVAAGLRTRAALVELCAIVRAMDAAEDGRIELEELRDGIRLQSGRTNGFAAFHEARVLLRTVLEVLDHACRRADPSPARDQVAYLHRDLRQWLLAELTGSADGQLPQEAGASPVADPRAPWLVVDPAIRTRNDGFVDELLHGARDRPVTGVLGAAWIRGWSAVPVGGDMFGEDPAELSRLEAALDALAGGRPSHLVQVERARPAPWRLGGTTMTVVGRARRSWSLPSDAAGIAAAAADRLGSTVITSDDLGFAIVEDEGYHAVLAPPAVAEAICGAPPLAAVARFRQYVEELGMHGDPPEDLLDIADRFGRLRRRSR